MYHYFFNLFYPLPGSGLGDCHSQRRLALYRLFSGPSDPPLLRAFSGRSPASCLPLLRALKDLLPVEAEPTSYLSNLAEVLQGLFPSVGGALQALARSSSRRLQENLFGGKFLKNAVALNLSGVVGARGALGLDRLSSQSVTVSLQKNRDLVQTVSRALEDPAFLSALRHTLTGLSGSGYAPLEQVGYKRASNVCKYLEIHESFYLAKFSASFEFCDLILWCDVCFVLCAL